MHTGESFLGPYRVLDLADEKGSMCGKILAGFGAEVIKIEPPEGDPGRHRGPFIGDKPGPNASLPWIAANLNKKSVTLDLETREGREIFFKLVDLSDFVVESFDPGYLDGLELGYEAIRRRRPSLVMTSITPFGQSGPHRDFKASDMACWASSGYMWLCGTPGLEPLRFSIPQAYAHGGAEAAMGSLVAFWHRQKTGQGQHVDVSIAESAMWECLGAHASWDMNQELYGRQGVFRAYGTYKIRFMYPCKDGHVIFMLIGGHVGARGQRALAEWMDREGMSNDFLRGFDWDSFDAANYNDEMARRLEPFFERFFRTKTKSELFAGALKMQYLLAPVNTVRDLLEGPHLAARDFWVTVEHQQPDIPLVCPGAPFKSNRVSWNNDRRAPQIGEHNAEIFGRHLALSAAEIQALRLKGVI
jgi:crotonobetainyl-CoA:carnitine CoA-transferase CaiB-like acyl-CoA transferase